MPQLRDFAGEWRLAREIREAGGRVSRLLGRAVFTPAEEGLDYREEGELELPDGRRFRAERRYLWRPAGAGRIAVLFADGRPFHKFSPGEAPRAEHWCDPDAYLVRYDFALWPAWRAEWRVKGPRKDYLSVTTYRRAEA